MDKTAESMAAAEVKEEAPALNGCEQKIQPARFVRFPTLDGETAWTPLDKAICHTSSRPLLALRAGVAELPAVI
jgi:hypothetical protein